MFLGIDIGTSAVKAVVLNELGALVTQTSAPLSVSQPAAGYSEQDPEDWWRATQIAVGALAEHRRNITAVGLSGQMHGLLALGADHAPLRPAMLWNDGRAQAQCSEITKAVPDVAQRVGVPLAAGFTAPKLSWLRKHEPSSYVRIRSLVSVKDYIGLKLHGNLVTDTSDAAGTCLLNQSTRSWDDRVCAAAGADPRWLPPVHAGWDRAGRVTVSAADATGIPVGTPVVTGGGDAAVGALAVGATEEGDAFLSLGTSAQLFIARDHYRPDAENFVHAFAHCLPERWYTMAAMLNGARPLAWFANLSGRSIPDVLLAASKVASDQAPLFLPYLTGERTPHGDSQVRAGFLEVADGHGFEHFARAVMDGIAFSMAQAFDVMSAGGVLRQPVQAVGGGSSADLLLQSIADLSGHRLVRSRTAQVGAAYGAALLARGHGFVQPRTDVDAVTFEPGARAPLEKYARFKAGYARVR